jgi:ATP adenylyltransferase
MEHVLGNAPRPTGCIFEPPGASSFDKANLLLFRDETVVVLLNRFPYANGHLLMAPRRHVADLTDLTAQENVHLMAMLAQSCTIIRRHLHPDGINLGINLGTVAGAGIADHLHVHLVPRWQDDHNFMTVCADIRTIPQHIEHTFDLLLDDFHTLLKGDTP